MENKEKILKTLKDFGRTPTARILAICGINYNYGLKELENLEKEKKIKKTKETSATYWEIKK